MYYKIASTIVFFIFFLCSIPLVSAQAVQKIGDNNYTIDASAVLEIESTTKGFLPPRMTTAQRNAIVSPVAGLTVYNTDKSCLEWYNGTVWYNGCGDNRSSNGTAIVSGFTCATASAGTMTAGTAVSGVTQTITASVSSVGTYSISAVANGVTFTGSGTFAGTGSQNVVLTASGTPAAVGTNSFALNTTPGCNFNRTTNASPTPGNIVLSSISPYFVASVYDTNYTPYATPTGPANLTTGTNPDGTTEKLIDIQGTITTTGVTVSIPYTVTTSPVTLPAYTQTITIPSGSTQDGISRDLTFSYPGATFPVGTGTITATLQAVGGTLNVKKLDIQTGIGNDNLGYLLGQFSYATNSSGGTANFAVRDITVIPDRNIANAQHVMLYLPIVSLTGKTWLNNNLGADYSNISKAGFNPAQQGTSATDYKAYGSLFQWGRKSDGHELITWTSGTAGTAVNGATATLSTTDTPAHALFITNPAAPYDWRSPQNDALWQGVNGNNNPCPVGFRLPTDAELTAEVTQYSITNDATAYSSIHKFVLSGYRGFNNATLSYTGSHGDYWSSTVSGTYASNRYFSSGGTYSSSDFRAYGFGVRCLKD